MILIINLQDTLISEFYFLNRNLHVSHRVSVHLQESSSVHTAIGIYRTGFADCLLVGSDPASKQSAKPL